MIIYLVILGKFKSGHELTLAEFCLYKKFQATDTSAHTTKVWARRDRRRVRVSQKRGYLNPFSCPKAGEHRLHLWCKKQQKQLSPEELLGTPEGVAVFTKWAPATGSLHRRYSSLDVFGEGEDEGVQE